MYHAIKRLHPLQFLILSTSSYLGSNRPGQLSTHRRSQCKDYSHHVGMNTNSLLAIGYEQTVLSIITPQTRRSQDIMLITYKASSVLLRVNSGVLMLSSMSA